MNAPALLPPITWIANPASLRRLSTDLQRQPAIAVDTESNSLYAYREQVCLLQISVPGADYLVDPLVLPDLAELAPIFAASGIEKVFHAAEYDIVCLRRDFGFTFTNIFDTMWAGRILGWSEVGLGNVLERHFGVHLNKRHQRANWGRRPLPPDQLDYARLDTYYLLALRELQTGLLKDAGRWELAQEDFARLCHVNGRNGNHTTEPCWARITGMRDLTPRTLAVLREVCEYRENHARQHDLPVFKVLSDAALLNIANACPTRFEDLDHIPNLYPRQVQRHGAAVLRAVQAGLAAPPLYPPALPPRPENGYLNCLDALRTWRKDTGLKLGVESDVVLPRDLMTELARQRPADAARLDQILAETPYRRATFGAEILKITSKHA